MVQTDIFKKLYFYYNVDDQLVKRYVMATPPYFY